MLGVVSVMANAAWPHAVSPCRETMAARHESVAAKRETVAAWPQMVCHAAVARLPRRRCTSATAPWHVCHAAVARLPRRRGKPFGRISSQKSALQRWQLAFPYRLDVYFLFPQASCERINAHYAARSAVWNGDIFCQPGLGVEISYITRVCLECM